MIVDAFRPLDESVVGAIGDVLDPFREELGIEDYLIEPREDHDGDPVIYVRFKHRLVQPRLPTGKLSAMENGLREVAWAKGERRFLHFRHNFDDRQLLDTDL